MAILSLPLRTTSFYLPARSATLCFKMCFKACCGLEKYLFCKLAAGVSCALLLDSSAHALLQSLNRLFFQGHNQLWMIFAAESLLARAKGNACLCKCKPYPFLGLCHLTAEGDDFAHPPLPYIPFRFSFECFIYRTREGYLFFSFLVFLFCFFFFCEQPAQTLDKFM